MSLRYSGTNMRWPVMGELVMIRDKDRMEKFMFKGDKVKEGEDKVDKVKEKEDKVKEED